MSEVKVGHRETTQELIKVNKLCPQSLLHTNHHNKLF